MFILTDNDTRKFSIVEILAGKGIVIMPCDTMYGFVGIAPETEDRLQEIKKREKGKKFLQLILPEWFSAFSSGPVDPSLCSLCPGKLTFIVKNTEGIVAAVRFPKDPFLVDLLKTLGKPLYSTSVNRSGEEVLFRSRDIIQEFDGEVDAFVDVGDFPGRIPSTILDITSRPYKIVRSGACRIPAQYFKE